jgi:hypothetical protein
VFLHGQSVLQRIGSSVMAMAIGATVAVLLISSRHERVSSEREPSGRPLEAIFDSSQSLLIPGERVPSLEAAADVTGVPLPGLPEGEEPSEVWASETGEAGIRFGSTIAVTYEPYLADREPTSVFEQQAVDWGIGYATEIHGVPAWVIPDHDGNPAPGVECIHLAMDGVEVTLYGKTTSQELLTLAESFAEAGSGD